LVPALRLLCHRRRQHRRWPAVRHAVLPSLPPRMFAGGAVDSMLGAPRSPCWCTAGATGRARDVCMQQPFGKAATQLCACAGRHTSPLQQLPRCAGALVHCSSSVDVLGVGTQMQQRSGMSRLVYEKHKHECHRRAGRNRPWPWQQTAACGSATSAF